MAARKVRICQEDWLPFQNLPAAVAAFERATGINRAGKWLCGPRQLLEDGLQSNALESAPLSVLYSPEFDRHLALNS